MSDTRQDEGCEARGQHDSGGEPQRRIQKLLRRFAPDHYNQSAKRIHKRYDNPADKPLNYGVIPGDSDKQISEPVMLHDNYSLKLMNVIQNMRTMAF
jgi:hypothetical protein